MDFTRLGEACCSEVHNMRSQSPCKHAETPWAAVRIILVSEKT